MMILVIETDDNYRLHVDLLVLIVEHTPIYLAAWACLLDSVSLETKIQHHLSRYIDYSRIRQGYIQRLSNQQQLDTVIASSCRTIIICYSFSRSLGITAIDSDWM